ncbi:MAG TPA: hypothetical protein VGC02_03595 [Methanobacterium sp.]
MNESLKNHWDDIISNPDYFYLVAEEAGNLASTCKPNQEPDQTGQAPMD